MTVPSFYTLLNLSKAYLTTSGAFMQEKLSTAAAEDTSGQPLDNRKLWLENTLPGVLLIEQSFMPR